MVEIAAKRFRDPTGTMGARGEIYWFAPGDEVPDEVVQRISASNLESGQPDPEPEPESPAGSMAGFEDATTMEQVATWVTNAPEAEHLARAEYALAAELEGGKRKTLIDQLETFIERVN